MTSGKRPVGKLARRLDALESLAITIAAIAIIIVWRTPTPGWRGAMVEGLAIAGAGMVAWTLVRIVGRTLLGAPILGSLYRPAVAVFRVEKVARWCREAGEAELARNLEDAASKANVKCIEIPVTQRDVRAMFRGNEAIKASLEAAIKQLCDSRLEVRDDVDA